jgi:hypothetical protein
MGAVAELDPLDEQSFPWDELLDTIDDGKLVPVLGHELLQAEVDGQPTTLQRVLATRLAASQRLAAPSRPHFELADVVAEMLELPRVRPDDPYPLVTRLMRGLNPPFPLPPALMQLAAIRPLQLFVSTTPDDLMARALDAVRHGGNALTRQLAFSLKQSTAAQGHAQDEPEEGLPVVFNLFGRFSTLPEYALHEEDALEFIHGLVSRDAPPPDWLMSRLRDRALLLLGVHLPEWLERFVLRGVNRGPLRSDRRTYWIARELEPSTASVALFFQRFGRDARLKVFHAGAVEFVVELARRWGERSGTVPHGDGGPPPPPADSHKSIFISYDWSNKDAVQRLFHEIDELSDGDCWFDRRNLLPGSIWERDIESALRRGVKLVIAVLSDYTNQKKGGEGVVFMEWRTALERARGIIGRDFIIPVVIDADATRADPDRYPKLMEAFPEFRRFTFGLAPGGLPNPDLLKAVRLQLQQIRM